MGGIFKSFIEIMPNSYCSSWTRRMTQAPSLEDFNKKRVSIRQTILKQVLDYLTDKHFCIVVGSRGRGKTWLCYALGFELKKTLNMHSARDIWFTTVDTNFAGEKAWNEIKSKKYKHAERYFIIEDCHENIEEVINLLNYIRRGGEQNLRFLFTLKKTGALLLKDTIDDLYDLGEDKDCIVRLQPSKEYVKGIIKKFMEAEKVQLSMSEDKLDSIAKRWHKDNLYRVRLRLKVWNFREGQSLDQIGDNEVFNFIYSDTEYIKLASKKRKDILLPLAAFCQFEPLFVWSPFIRDRCDESTFQNLRNEGIIELLRWKGRDFLRIQGKDAGLFLGTVEYKEKFNIQDYTKDEFKEYLKLLPPNLCFIFYNLYLASKEDTPYLAKEVLAYIVQDDEAWQKAKLALKEYKDEITLWEIYIVLYSLKKMDETKKAKDIWLYYINLKGSDHVIQKLLDWEASGISSFLRVMIKVDKNSAESLSSQLSSFSAILREKPIRSSITVQATFYHIFHRLNPKLACELLAEKNTRKDLQDKLKWSTAGSIRHIIRPLNKVINLEELFNGFSTSDLEHIIDRSKLNTIRLLFIDFKHLGLLTASNNLAKALPNANLNRLITLEKAHLRQLNGLLDNVEEINTQEAQRLINILSTQDLNHLVSRADSKIINYFLSKSVRLSPSFASIMVDKMNDKILARIIRSASPHEDFWLVWNVYRTNPAKAKRLISNYTIGHVLLKGRAFSALSTSSLALLGLLYLCHFGIENILLTKTDNFLAIAQTLCSEKSPTLLVLSLIALKVKLTSGHFQSFIKTINLHTIKDKVDTQPDIQLRKLLQSMLRDSRLGL